MIDNHNVSKKWERVVLGSISRDISYGYTASSTDKPIGPRMLRITDIQNNSVNWAAVPYCKIVDDEIEKYILRPNDIVFARTGATVGKSFLIPSNVSNSVYASYLIRVRLADGIDPKYISYFFQSGDYWIQIRKNQAGIGQPNVNGSKLKKIEIPLAPPEQQKQIVAKIEELFSHIDAGIEALNTAKQRLKQYRQSVLKAAVTGELTKEWREANKDKLEPASQLLERILQTRRQKWEEQQLEQFKAKGKLPKNDKWKDKYKEPAPFSFSINIPESWVGVTTDQVFYYVTSGSRGWAKYYSDDGSLFLRMGNLEHYDVNLDLEKIQRVSPPEGTEGSRTKVMAGDSLISITADVGMVGIVPDAFEEAYINQHVALARPALEGMGLYLAWLLSGDFAKEQFKALQRGATKVGLGLDDIKAIQFGLPSIKEQNEIVWLIEEKLNAIERLAKELDLQLLKAEKNKQSILASAFLGKLTASPKGADL